MFWRPDPMYRVGNLVKYTMPKQKDEYLLIGNWWWMRPKGHFRKQWIYDGILFCLDQGSLKLLNYIPWVLEENLGSHFKSE